MKTPASNPELVVYTLHLLGGAVARIHTEDIALKAHELFPDSFSWTRHPHLPDKDVARVALTDARKPKYGVLVEGRTGQQRGQSSKTNRGPAPDGWILTAAGIEWVRSNQQRLEALPGSGEQREHRQKVLKQLRRVKSHRLFGEFARAPHRFEPDIGTLAELLRCRVDADHEVWIERLEGIRSRARLSGQDDILAFIDVCEAAYESQK